VALLLDTVVGMVVVVVVVEETDIVVAAVVVVVVVVGIEVAAEAEGMLTFCLSHLAPCT
jgi:hypothetical protein